MGTNQVDRLVRLVADVPRALLVQVNEMLLAFPAPLSR
jgi:hypothetical protein